MTMNTLPIELIRSVIDYDPETGAMVWKDSDDLPPFFNRRLIGAPALASVHRTGYLHGHLFGLSVKAHRVAWAIHYGKWPELFIDHIDRDRANNRIANLRIATRSQNGRNKVSKQNTSSQYLGVSYHISNRKWQASIRDHGQDIHIGYFDDEVKAARAYDAAALKIHGEFANPNFPISSRVGGSSPAASLRHA
jgi:hypothetical protein